MGASSQTKRELPPLARRETVVMGSQSYVSIVLRLIGVELYKLRRRALSRILGVLAIIAVVIVFALIGSWALVTRSMPAASFGQTSVGTASNARALQARQDTLQSISQPLRLPDSFTTSAQIIDYVGLILIIILAGSIVGGEYSVGTVRLMFTRGPTRGQFFLAKLGTILACTILGTVVLMALGVVIGAFFNFLLGIGSNLHFLTAAWLGHALIYTLTVVLNLFVYAIIAVFLSILGKTTTAGVAGTLIWWVVENVLGSVLSIVGALGHGPVNSFMQAIPNYFISTNVDALQQNQHAFLLGDRSFMPQVSDVHALLMLACYLILLIGLSWWVMQKRDVTN